jgi:hypothetical protein
MMKTRLLLFCFIALSLSLSAQEVTPWENNYDRMGDLDDAESESFEQEHDVLSDLAANPLNLNTATREDLEALPFLSSQQVMDICAYLYKYGPMRSMGELMLIESLDQNVLDMLRHFVYVGEEPAQAFPALANILKYGHNELVATARIPFYRRHGDRNGYLGYPYKHWLRYTFSYAQQVQAGVIASQDAGEPFLAHHNQWGYDYYSFYLVVRKLGALKALAVGRYRLHLGLGLVMNNDFSFGKLATLQTLGSQTNTIRAHSSRLEANYLQGAAATVTLLKGLDLTGFVSYRDIDATLNADSTSIATIVTSGYHRTESEMARKHNTSQWATGTHLRYFTHGFHVGMTALYTSLSRELRPGTEQLYRRYYPAGRSFWNAGVDYGYMGSRLAFSGETATGDCRALATLNTLSYQVSSQLSLMALQRFYSYQYYSLFAQSFSDGGSVQNESGLYVGAVWHPSRRLALQFYTDYAYAPWARYQISASSHAWDNLLSATWSNDRFTLLARYRLRLREKDNADHTGLIDKTEHRARLAVGYAHAAWTLRTQVDLADCQLSTNSFGWMATQNIGYNGQRLHLNADLSYFHTDGYDSRVYAYERSTLYNFSYPVYSGQGIRYAFFVAADVTPHLLVIAKVGTTDYFDRDHISSSYQQIDHSAQTDLDVQVRWRF